MSMTRQEVLRALADGKQLQSKSTKTGPFFDRDEHSVLSVLVDCPEILSLDEWRIKPTPKRTWLGHDKLPGVFWVRLSASFSGVGKPGNPKLCLGLDGDGSLYVAGHGMTPLTQEALMERYEWAAGHTVSTWNPFWKEVES